MNPQAMPSDDDIFSRALACEGAERDALLAMLCPDSLQRQRVEALLAVHASMDSGFLNDPPVFDGGATMLLPAEVLPTGSFEQPGDVIGPYLLREKLGEGGFGIVWLAEQEQPVRRRVALKIIKAGMDTREVVARFEQERQALALMEHENIARVFDAGATAQGRPFFAMELVRGTRITDYCDQQRLTVDQRAGLFLQVCAAVQHAHQKGIIHRDIKPSNVLVTVNDGQPVAKVIDFGVAKATQGGGLAGATYLTQFQQVLGTPLYMSPEQAERTSQDIDTRSDIYSLGVLLYEMLTGSTPIDHQTVMKAGLDEIRRVIREVEPPRPSIRVKNLPAEEQTHTAQRRHAEPARLPVMLRGELDWIVMRCLEKDRRRRYDTAIGLAADLRRYLEGGVVTAHPPSRLYVFGKVMRRNKAAFATAAVITISLLAGAGISLWQAVRAVRAERQVRGALMQAEADRATARAVSDFLQKDLLALAAPDVQVEQGLAGKTDLTVRQAVERATAKATSAFAGKPMLEAEVRLTLGKVLESLSDPARATREFESAAKLLEVLHGKDHESALYARMRQAAALRRGGHTEESLKLIESTCDALERSLGSAHDTTLEAKNHLGWVHYQAGRQAEAQAAFRTVLAALNRGKTSPPLQHGAMLGLASSLWASGEHAEGRTAFEEAIRLRQEQLGPDHPETVQAVTHFSQLQAELDKDTGGDGVMRLEELLINLGRSLPKGHRSTIEVCRKLTALHEKGRRLEEALRLRRLLAEHLRAAMQADGIKDDADALTRLTSELVSELAVVGKLLRLMQRPQEAQPSYEEALKLSERHHIGTWERDAMRSIIGELSTQQDADGAQKMIFESYQKLAEARRKGVAVPLAVLQAASARISALPLTEKTAREAALGLLERSGLQLGKYCYWPETRDALERYLEIDPKNSDIRHRLIPVLAWLKDIPAWKKANLDAVADRRARGLWEHLIKDALVLTDPAVPLDILRAENERARRENRYDYGYGWDPLAEGLLLYREGNLQAALEKAAKLRSTWHLEPVEMQSHALLMICEHRLGLGNMTLEERLASLERQRKRLPRLEPGDQLSAAHSGDQLTSVILLEEARRVVMAEPETSPPAAKGTEAIKPKP